MLQRQGAVLKFPTNTYQRIERTMRQDCARCGLPVRGDPSLMCSRCQQQMRGGDARMQLEPRYKRNDWNPNGY